MSQPGSTLKRFGEVFGGQNGGKLRPRRLGRRSGGLPGEIFVDLALRAGAKEARHEGVDAGQTSGQTRHPLMSLAMSSAMSPPCCCGWFVKGSRAFGQGGRGPKSISEVPLNPASGKIFSLILALRGFLARCSLINNPHGPGGTWTHCCLGLAKPWNFNPSM